MIYQAINAILDALQADADLAEFCNLEFGRAPEFWNNIDLEDLPGSSGPVIAIVPQSFNHEHVEVKSYRARLMCVAEKKLKTIDGQRVTFPGVSSIEKLHTMAYKSLREYLTTDGLVAGYSLLDESPETSVTMAFPIFITAQNIELSATPITEGD